MCRKTTSTSCLGHFPVWGGGGVRGQVTAGHRHRNLIGYNSHSACAVIYYRQRPHLYYGGEVSNSI
jgi:hypothetical protein